MRDESLYIVMPAYNEESNIEAVVREWYPILSNASEKSKLVVADGGSSDNTLVILKNLQREMPKLVVLSEPDTDHGTKVIILYKYAASKGADWIFQTDSDGQTRPEEFNLFWNLRQQYDVILGNRKKRGDGYGRKIVENILRLYIKIFFDVWIPDANAPFRLMRTNVTAKYFPLIPKRFNLPNALLAACFTRYREKVCYCEITFMPRQGGKNYMNVKRIVKIGVESIHNFHRIHSRMELFESMEGKCRR